jgi:hypothetical protein
VSYGEVIRPATARNRERRATDERVVAESARSESGSARHALVFDRIVTVRCRVAREKDMVLGETCGQQAMRLAVQRRS